MADGASASRPDVSFAVASYNSGPLLEDAVASALAQTDVSVEVLIVDDGSRDGSLERARSYAERDPRVRVFQTERNGGPGAARNVSLANMRGVWYAILDSDDLVSPDRSRRLIDQADAVGADLIADDLSVFGEGIDTHPLIGDTAPGEAYWLDLETYVRRSCLFNGQPGYGFLKPMIRRELIRDMGLRYDEELRIGEDDELIVQLLVKGARYWCISDTGYQYRKHENSISHRLSPDHARRMLKAEHRLRSKIGHSVSDTPAFRARLAALTRGLAFVESVDHLKSRRVWAAVRPLLAQPRAALLYKMPLQAAWHRRRNR